ncbi:MAG: toll/interleukin-1 receptor domain-containing protein [Synergistaceae bacterium]|jgi:hypothetical protein|nr:toll/interleukin-1 receptor domain-containing protein [Synergistaceae bacterium]
MKNGHVGFSGGWKTTAFRQWFPRRRRKAAALKRFTVFRGGAGSNRETLTDASALEASRYLIVVCSPRSAESGQVDGEVRRFVETGRSENIIPFIIEGSPVSSTPPPASAAERQCYPPSLSPNILGVTLSDGSREEALIKIIARLLRVRYHRLYQRHLKERRRFLRRALAVVSAILAVMVVLTSLALMAETEAKERREAADGLVEFLAAEAESQAFSNLPAGPRSVVSEKIREHYEKRGEKR